MHLLCFVVACALDLLFRLLTAAIICRSGISQTISSAATADDPGVSDDTPSSNAMAWNVFANSSCDSLFVGNLLIGQL